VQRGNPSGRFLKQDKKTKLWYIMDRKDALAKTRMAFKLNSDNILDEIAYERYSTLKMQPLTIKNSVASDDCNIQEDQNTTMDDHSLENGIHSELRNTSISLKSRGRIFSQEPSNADNEQKVMQFF